MRRKCDVICSSETVHGDVKNRAKILSIFYIKKTKKNIKWVDILRVALYNDSVLG